MSRTAPSTAHRRQTGSRVVLALLVASLVLAGSATPVATQEAEPDARLEEFAYAGEGQVGLSDGELHVWQADSHRFAATVASNDGLEGTVCFVAAPAGVDNATELGCEPTTVPANGTATATVSTDGWPADVEGAQEVRALVRDTNASAVLASESLSLTVLRRDGDLDDDGLSNEREASLGTEIRAADTDGDGLADGEEVETYGTSPVSEDSDGDGLSDRAEVETYETDPTAPDSDGDGLPDDRELSVGTNPNEADSDGDGLNDALEVNTHGTDPMAPDTDSDGLDDGAEVETHDTNPTESDTDGDGLEDGLEVNTYGTDPNKVDSDGDGLADGVEVSEYQTDPATADSDGDGLEDGREVNAYGTNPTNPDTDGDGLKDGSEVNRHETDPTAADSDGDGRGDGTEVSGGVPAGLAVLGAVGVIVALVAGYAVVRYRSDGRLPLPWRRSSETGGGEPGAGDAGADREEVAADVPPEFLPNEEQVLRLLEDHGGRMRQTALVEETGWSKSKVSRVLAEMEDDGQIVKVDVGKGNVVTRPEDLPEGAQPPFEA